MDPFVRSNLKLALTGKKIALGITGSVAAFKACDVIRFLKQCGAEVRVILTESARQFVTSVTCENLSGNPVGTSLWQGVGTHHIEMARWADLFLVTPASANTIGKLAQGLADDLLSTELLAFKGPVLIAPAMNPGMWDHPAVQANVQKCKDYGYRMINPVEGVTACGEVGKGRLPEPDEIVEEVADAFRAPLNGKKVLITLGPTRSFVDPVRYLTNRSSGKMGSALAWSAYRRGYEVTVVQGDCEVRLPKSIQVSRASTAKQMRTLVLDQWSQSDIFISAAAVLDWDVKNPAAQKLKKTQSLQVEFEKNPDILKEVAQMAKDHQFVVGFAAETREPVHNGMSKLKNKNVNALFVNDVSSSHQGFESDLNAGWWMNAEDTVELPQASKAEIADSIFMLIEGDKPKDTRWIIHQPQSSSARPHKKIRFKKTKRLLEERSH